MRVVKMSVGWVVIAGVLISSCSSERILGFTEDGGRGGEGGENSLAGDGSQLPASGGRKAGGTGGTSTGGSFAAGARPATGGSFAAGARPATGGSSFDGGTGSSEPQAGSAPVAGSGGTSGSGSEPLPQGGCTAEDLPEPLEFPQCSENPFYMEGSFCSETDTRRVLRCGTPGSTFDPACCRRATCLDDADCGANAVCIPRPTQAPIGIAGSLVEGCHMECESGCSCSITEDIDLQAYCIAKDENVAAFDCNIEGMSCKELSRFHSTLTEQDALYEPIVTGGQYEERMNACADRIEAALAADCREEACTCRDTNCRTSVAALCPGESEFGCPASLDLLEKARAICDFDGDFGVYQQCDETVSFQWTEGFENEYELIFDASTRNLQYGSASGWVNGLCPSSPTNEDGSLTIVAGTKPVTRSNCRSCSFCGWTSSPDFAGPAPCVFGSDGRIALPAP